MLPWWNGSGPSGHRLASAGTVGLAGSTPTPSIARQAVLPRYNRYTVTQRQLNIKSNCMFLYWYIVWQSWYYTDTIWCEGKRWSICFAEQSLLWTVAVKLVVFHVFLLSFSALLRTYSCTAKPVHGLTLGRQPVFPTAQYSDAPTVRVLQPYYSEGVTRLLCI